MRSRYLRLNRRGQPMGMSLITILALAICLIFLVSTIGLAGSIVLDDRADNNQLDELNALVHEIKLVCQGHGPRNLQFTTIPGRGIVFIRDLYPDALREKIVAKTGCEQYCLCAIRKANTNEDLMETIMDSDGEGSEELVAVIVDPDTKILSCVDLRKVAPTKGEQACFRSVVLSDALNCDTCTQVRSEWAWWKPLDLEDFWALPLMWGVDVRFLYIPENNCAWRTKLTLNKNAQQNLQITTWSFSDLDAKTCTFFRCDPPTIVDYSKTDSDTLNSWCPY